MYKTTFITCDGRERKSTRGYNEKKPLVLGRERQSLIPVIDQIAVIDAVGSAIVEPLINLIVDRIPPLIDDPISNPITDLDKCFNNNPYVSL